MKIIPLAIACKVCKQDVHEAAEIFLIPKMHAIGIKAICPICQGQISGGIALEELIVACIREAPLKNGGDGKLRRRGKL